MADAGDPFGGGRREDRAAAHFRAAWPQLGQRSWRDGISCGPILDRRRRILWAATEAEVIGSGGRKLLHDLTGVSASALSQRIRDIRSKRAATAGSLTVPDPWLPKVAVSLLAKHRSAEVAWLVQNRRIL